MPREDGSDASSHPRAHPTLTTLLHPGGAHEVDFVAAWTASRFAADDAAAAAAAMRGAGDARTSSRATTVTSSWWLRHTRSILRSLRATRHLDSRRGLRGRRGRADVALRGAGEGRRCARRRRGGRARDAQRPAAARGGRDVRVARAAHAAAIPRARELRRPAVCRAAARRQGARVCVCERVEPGRGSCQMSRRRRVVAVAVVVVASSPAPRRRAPRQTRVVAVRRIYGVTCVRARCGLEGGGAAPLLLSSRGSPSRSRTHNRGVCRTTSSSGSERHRHRLTLLGRRRPRAQRQRVARGERHVSGRPARATTPPRCRPPCSSSRRQRPDGLAAASPLSTTRDADDDDAPRSAPL